MRTLLSFAVLLVPTLARAAIESEDEFAFWLRHAEQTCDEIVDGRLRSDALAKVHALRLVDEQIEHAQDLTKRITNPSQRTRAHIRQAAYFSAAGNMDQCNLELAEATEHATDLSLRLEIAKAYLGYAKEPKLAIKVVTNEELNARTELTLCKLMSEHRFYEEALDFANSSTDNVQRRNLRRSVAYATANAGLIDKTERIVEQMGNEESEYVKQEIWLKLVIRLRSDGNELAEQFSARITHHRLRRELQKLVDSPDKQSLQTSDHDQTFDQMLANVTVKQLVDNAALNDLAGYVAEIETRIKQAKASPVESKSGNLGPYNQKIRLAMLEFEYVKAGLALHVAGRETEAQKFFRMAEDSVQVLVEQQALFSSINLTQLHTVQLAMNDIEGLKRTTNRFHNGLWVRQAKHIVSKLLEHDDVEGATRIARSVLSSDPRILHMPKHLKDIVPCFIRNGETSAALDLLKLAREDERGAVICENAGRTMIDCELKSLLSTSAWRNGLMPYQRACLFIGAAKASADQAQRDS